jgi:hypothetical protein
MKSPQFDVRAKPLQQIFAPDNLERIWSKKVRISMREQLLNDGIEWFDFHTDRKVECAKLSKLILEGSYAPSPAQRILVEKSRGLCRQLVIPSVADAIVLQCLSDKLYLEVRNKAPTNKAFFEPKEHNFSSNRGPYGAFAAWLNFQRELFNFSRTRPYVVVTDIANYYDSISYVHLRNAISSISTVEECVLDMLIHVLSSLLWQPDYMPRVEIGLPQINLDAPRLLAHCFLYELDRFLGNTPNIDFVRYMDDIDIGVDSTTEAKQMLKSVDLVLQTKQIRLNSGKTKILTQSEAAEHFRVRQNAFLDILRERIIRKRAKKQHMARERRLIERRINAGLAKKRFDEGNGDKVLKRWIGLAGETGARLQTRDLRRMLLFRPTLRENVYGYVRRADLSPARSALLADAAESGHFVDDAALVSLVNYLAETTVPSTSGNHAHIMRIANACDPSTFFGFYCHVWLLSKYGSPSALLGAIVSFERAWNPHEHLGRLVGSLTPLFVGTPQKAQFTELLGESRNPGARDAYKFHRRLASQAATFSSMFPALSNPNFSRGTGITHAKFLCLLSALQNPVALPARKATLKSKNAMAWRDIYYRQIGRRLRVYP